MSREDYYHRILEQNQELRGQLAELTGGTGPRTGNPERDVAVRIVREAFAGGYLDDSEREDRIARILTAKTQPQLVAILADLPLPQRRRGVRELLAAHCDSVPLWGAGIAGGFVVMILPGVLAFSARVHGVALAATVTATVLLGLYIAIATLIGALNAWERNEKKGKVSSP